MFLVDDSNSMNEKLKGVPKIEIVREGLRRFCLESWPSFYPQWPLKIGITAFNLKGVMGKTNIEELVPVLVSPTREDLSKVANLKPTGGNPVYDALVYAKGIMDGVASIDRMRGSTTRRIKLISDGGNKGPDPLSACDRIARAGMRLDAVELADKPSSFMARIAETGQGIHYVASTVEELMFALELPRFGESY